MKNIDITKLTNIIEKEIKNRGFESLHYVLFDENKRLPWAFHLFYRDGKFYVNGRDDRSYVIGHEQAFDNFEEAKYDFFEKLDLVVTSNRLNKQLGYPTEYDSSLWE